MAIVHLPDRGVVKVVGEDARTFLNGLITSDMEHVSPKRAGFAALLSPQGKILFDFIIAEAPAEDGGGFFLDCPLALAPDLMKRLNLYRLRARVIVEDLSEILGVAAVLDESAFDPEDYLAYGDPRLPALGMRLIGERNGLKQMAGDPSSYHTRRVELGVPEGGKDFAYSDAFPHEALMDQLGGVDFRKGCYVGQEVVSRMEHRNAARTRVMCVTYPDGFGPEPGVEILAGDRAIGRTGSHVRGRGLAVLRLDKLADATGNGVEITAGGIPLVAEKPPYAKFGLPTV